MIIAYLIDIIHSMKRSSLLNLKKVSSYLKKENKRKYISLEMISNAIGIYPDVLADDLAFLNPILMMDPSFNIKDLYEPLLEAIYQEENKTKDPKAKRDIVHKKELKEYKSISDFVYKKFTNAGGLVDSSITLSDHDLMVLKKLVEKENSDRRKAKRAKKANATKAKA